jgi:hypothetical protein
MTPQARRLMALRSPSKRVLDLRLVQKLSGRGIALTHKIVTKYPCADGADIQGYEGVF